MPPPPNDIWQNYVDLDLRMFDKTANRIKVHGSSFSSNDRTQAQVVVRKIIEKTLVPFCVSRIHSIE